jgi:hypothetical protein
LTSFLTIIRNRLRPEQRETATLAQFDQAPEAWKHLVPPAEVPADYDVQPTPVEPEHIDFDEEWYLRRYPDVALALKERPGSSGLAHYLLHGRNEGRLPAPPVQPKNDESHGSAREWSGGRIA